MKLNLQQLNQMFSKIMSDISQRFLAPNSSLKEFVSPVPDDQIGNGAKPPAPEFQEPTPEVAYQPDPSEVIKQGMADWGRGEAPPMATMSAELAQAGEGLPNPYLPAALSLKETGGLRDSQRARELNNPFGIGPHIQYPDLPTSILGGGTGGVDGGPQKGLVGVLGSGAYDKYLDSGELEDFFATYTPTSDPNNPTMQQQIATMVNLLDYFENAEENLKKNRSYARR